MKRKRGAKGNPVKVPQVYLVGFTDGTKAKEMANSLNAGGDTGPGGIYRRGSFTAAKTRDGWVVKGKPVLDNPGKGAFERCVRDVSAKGGAYDPRAVCAAAGRKKYGAGKFQQMAAAGKRAAARRRHNPAAFDRITPGARVTILVPAGFGRGGQEYRQATGRAVMRGPHGWALNMGGPYGTPGVATPDNTVKVTAGGKKRGKRNAGGKSSTAQAVRAGSALELIKKAGALTPQLAKARDRVARWFDTGKGKYPRAAVDSLFKAARGQSNPATLAGILKNRYGVTIDTAPVEAVLWAAARVKPIAEARRQLAAANRQRERAGKVPAVPAYGDPLFNRSRSNPAKKRKRNPDDTAAARYEVTHGRPPQEVTEITTKIHRHSVLSGIGKLIELVIVSGFGYQVTLRNFKGALLAEDEKGRQLYIEGGDQSVNLADFGIRRDPPHESEVLGELVRVTYDTRKDHLGADGGDAYYKHRFFKREPPTVIYDTRNRLLSLSGGGYGIEGAGIIG